MPRSIGMHLIATQFLSFSISSHSSSSNAYGLLTFLGEILGAKPLPGSAELVSGLLDTLSRVVHDSSVSVAEKTYVEQLLMSALENAAMNIPVSYLLPSA